MAQLHQQQQPNLLETCSVTPFESVASEKDCMKLAESYSLIELDNSSSSDDSESDATEELLRRSKMGELVAHQTKCRIHHTDDTEFHALLGDALEAISMTIYPQLCHEGSSGSYFVYNKENKPIGVFKPKDEEPFAPLNPKWPKFFQRYLCFCCFGRACLIPNVGYLSETAASLVDERFGLFIVPKTRVVKLSSPTFHYGNSWFFGYPRVKGKEGSFQTFVHGFRSAEVVLAEWASKPEPVLSPEDEERFTILFQKMCILDYAIRNTDRHMDNWLIRHVPDEPIQLAAIDNGLAFPVQHPECASLLRTFPFAWSELSWAQKPLNQDLRKHMLDLLTPIFVHHLCEELTKFFKSGREHNPYLTYCQLRVFRGQLWNLKDALENDECPAQWAKRTPILAKRRSHHGPSPGQSFEECFQKLPANEVDGSVLLLNY